MVFPWLFLADYVQFLCFEYKVFVEKFQCIDINLYNRYVKAEFFYPKTMESFLSIII